MSEPRNIRMEKGPDSPSTKGEGATYFIPLEDAPEGLQCGEKYRIILEGVVNPDDQGVSIKLESITAEKVEESRLSPTQSKLESELNMVIKSK